MKNNLTIENLYEKYLTLKQTIKAGEDAKKEKKIIESLLSSKIPQGQTKLNITHKVTNGSSVAYAQALKEIRPLIPKTKQEALQNIIEKNTNTYKKHNFVKREQK